MSDDIEDLISEVGNSLLNYASKEYVKIGDPADKRYENACEAIRTKFDALNQRIAELEAEVTKCHELQDSYCDRIAELEAAQRWIPVSERLPEDRATILAAFKNREILTATYYKHYEGFGGVENYWHIEGWHSGNVTHWTPLPEPLEERER